jgi:hypothetical protein
VLFSIGCDNTFYKRNTVNMAGKIQRKIPQKFSFVAHFLQAWNNTYQRYNNVPLCSALQP